MILKKDRKETKFEVMDNMLDIWKQITELSFRGFGKRMRKSQKFQKISTSGVKNLRING